MSAASSDFSDKEAEIYDRQIRLWGVDGQRRLRAARVLVSGLRATGAEIVKNIVLAGTNVVIHDTASVEEADLGAQFFLRAADVGHNRATASLPRVQELNPLVEAVALEKPIAAFSDDEWRAFRLVVLCDYAPAEQVAVADRLHALGVPVLTTSTHGFWATFFVDFGRHEYTLTHPTAATASSSSGSSSSSASASAASASAAAPAPLVIEYPSMGSVLAAPWTAIKTKRNARGYTAWAAWMATQLDGSAEAGAAAASSGDAAAAAPSPAAAAAIAFARSAAAASGVPVDKYVDEAIIAALVDNAGVELSPVAAVVGGIVGNEVVKLMTGKDEPLLNFFVFDAMGATARPALGGAVVAVVP